MSVVSFKIASRFLGSSKGQTALIVVGIAIAISVQVFVGLLLSSLQAGLLESTVGNSPQVTVVSARENVTIDGWEAIVDDVDGIDGIRAVAVSASSNAFVEKGQKVEPALIRGFDFDDADDIYHMLDGIYEGDRPTQAGYCMLGRELAEELGIGPGDNLTVITSFGSRINLMVSGLFDLGVESLNKAWVMTLLGTAQQIFQFGDRVTSIEMAVDDVFEADTIAAKVDKRISDPDVKVENWKDQNKQLLSALQSQGISSNMIQSFILISVIIAIASILSVTVVQKSKQIGILKAMGIKDRQASLIFLYQGTILGIGGAVLGISLGVGLLFSFTTFARGDGGEALITIIYEPLFLVGSFLVTVLSSMFAAVLPARKSSKLSPIEVIRGG